MQQQDINVAQLYSDIGALKAQSEERTKQTDELFKLVRGMAEKMATKEDIKELSFKVDAGHVRVDDLHDRVSNLESDRRWIKAGVGAAFGLPPVIAALVEIVRFIWGRH